MKDRKDNEMERLLANDKVVMDLGYYKGQLVLVKSIYKKTGLMCDKQLVDHYGGIVYEMETIAFKGKSNG